MTCFLLYMSNRKSASWAGKKKFTDEDSTPKFASQAFRASYPRPTSGRSGESGRKSGGGQAIDIPHKNRSESECSLVRDRLFNRIFLKSINVLVLIAVPHQSKI